MGSPAAWARSIALGDFESAEYHPESTVAFERVPLFADENEGEDKLAVAGREIHRNLLAFFGTLLDPSSFEISGRFEDAMRCWIEGSDAVVCGLATRWQQLVTDLDLNFYARGGPNPGRYPIDLVLMERCGSGREIVAAGG